ncbi:hypothetical protein D3C73_968220 [compost metagenome]
MLADDDPVVFDRISFRLPRVDLPEREAAQQRRAGVRFGLGPMSVIDHRRFADVGFGRKAPLYAQSAHSRAVLPPVAVAVVEDCPEDKRLIRQRIADQADLRGCDIGDGPVQRSGNLSLVNVRAGADACADPHQIG